MTQGDWTNLFIKTSLLLGLFTAQGHAQVQFSAPVPVDTLSFGTTFIWAADVHEDHIPDLLVGRYTLSRKGVWLYPGLENAQFGEAVLVDSTLSRPVFGRPLDLNQDPFTDLVIVSGVEHGKVWAYTNQGGTFTEKTLIDSVHFPTGLQVQDLDRDGNTDLIVLGDLFLGLYFSHGNGSFTKIVLPTLSEYYSVTVADFTGDGFPDLAVGGVHVLLFVQQGDGSFLYDSLRSASLVPVGMVVLRVRQGDMNGDSFPDLVTFHASTLQWVPNLGNGFFGPPQVINSDITGLPDVYPIDLDLDSDIDLLVTHPQEGTVVWYPNLGAGDFGPSQIIGQGPVASLRHVLGTDLNQDTLPDVVWADPLSVQVQVPMAIHESQEPTRTKDDFFVTANGTRLKVHAPDRGFFSLYSLDGRLLFKDRLAGGTHFLDRKLRPGVYAAQFRTHNQVFRTKFLMLH